MPKVMQNLVVLAETCPFGKYTRYNYDMSMKGGNMCLNRFCIDEDAAFELSGIYSIKLKRDYNDEVSTKGMEYQLTKLTINSTCVFLIPPRI